MNLKKTFVALNLAFCSALNWSEPASADPPQLHIVGIETLQTETHITDSSSSVDSGAVLRVETLLDIEGLGTQFANSGVIKIARGGKLVIEKKALFLNNRRIVVEPGGQLIVGRNSKLQNHQDMLEAIRIKDRGMMQVGGTVTGGRLTIDDPDGGLPDSKGGQLHLRHNGVVGTDGFPVYFSYEDQSDLEPFAISGQFSKFDLPPAVPFVPLRAGSSRSKPLALTSDPPLDTVPDYDLATISGNPGGGTGVFTCTFEYDLSDPMHPVLWYGQFKMTSGTFKIYSGEKLTIDMVDQVGNTLAPTTTNLPAAINYDIIMVPKIANSLGQQPIPQPQFTYFDGNAVTCFTTSRRVWYKAENGTTFDVYRLKR